MALGLLHPDKGPLASFTHSVHTDFHSALPFLTLAPQSSAATTHLEIAADIEAGRENRWICRLGAKKGRGYGGSTHQVKFLERERRDRQNGISNTREPSRQLDADIAALSESALQIRKTAGGGRSSPPCVLRHYRLRPTTAPPPSTVAANTLNGRQNRRFGQPAIVVYVSLTTGPAPSS